MALAALRSATSLPSRALGRRLLAAGLVTGAAAVWAPRARAETALSGVSDEVCQCDEQLPAGGDGLEELRQRIRAYGLRPLEDKLVSLMREFKADEKQHLMWFADAEHTGNDGRMRVYHSLWTRTTQQMELLQSNPRKFVRKYGFLYDLKTGSIFDMFF